MKKIIACALALCFMLSLSGCAQLLGGTRTTSGSDVSGSDTVSSSDTTPIVPEEEDEEEDFDFVITYRSIAASWETAADDEAYLAAAQERLDEYTLLITSLGTMLPELASRCDSADDVRRDDAYMPLSAALVQWSKNVIGYDSSALGEQAAAVHQKLLALAQLTEEYIELVPTICLAEDTAESDGYIDDILGLMIEADTLL